MGFNGDLAINNRDLVGFNGDVMGDIAGYNYNFLDLKMKYIYKMAVEYGNRWLSRGWHGGTHQTLLWNHPN